MTSGADNDRWVIPAGTSALDGWDVCVRPGAGWRHAALWVGTLEPGASRRLDLSDYEAIVVPLSGGAVQVAMPGWSTTLRGRSDVWAGPTDGAYVPAGPLSVLSPHGARVAVCGAALGDRPAAPPRRLDARDVPVELRGTGNASREVRNFGVPSVLDAGRIIACEVLTPAGNWSSWPPHKHDEERPGVETELEEIYYFEARSSVPGTARPQGLQRVYGDGSRSIDVLTAVGPGDVVLVPHGWHGPSIAAPDADLYYLNVMAGPGHTREWLICDDPTHTAVRGTWSSQPVDPRLPFGSGQP